ncbi:hypothetical protein [Streptomyces sp. NPDC052092]|uniref:hypothetical protein n=1 Tax=Streptomyces sp. NPDC052092 TaxID=3365685 RepID=UPI0037CE1D94
MALMRRMSAFCWTLSWAALAFSIPVTSSSKPAIASLARWVVVGDVAQVGGDLGGDVSNSAGGQALQRPGQGSDRTPELQKARV